MEDSLGRRTVLATWGMRNVLILVVMEDSLGLSIFLSVLCKRTWVLILVVMEDSLGRKTKELKNGRNFVLILVVMEDSLGLAPDVGLLSS